MPGFLSSLSRATPSADSAHLSEFSRLPNLRCCPTCCVRLELRSLPSLGVTRLLRYYEPLRRPVSPGHPSRASGCSSQITARGLPCCARFPCVHAAASTPVQRLGVVFAQVFPAVSAFPGMAAGSACTSSFSRLARRSLALRPAHLRRHQFVTPLIEGFGHFVTSMPAPTASGWSDVAGRASHPLESAALSRRT
jgi:hypothetical protein